MHSVTIVGAWNNLSTRVLASAEEHAAEQPRRGRETGRLSQKALKLLPSTEDVDAKLAILAEDLKDERHYQPLAAYNHICVGPGELPIGRIGT